MFRTDRLLLLRRVCGYEKGMGTRGLKKREKSSLESENKKAEIGCCNGKELVRELGGDRTVSSGSLNWASFGLKLSEQSLGY